MHWTEYLCTTPLLHDGEQHKITCSQWNLTYDGSAHLFKIQTDAGREVRLPLRWLQWNAEDPLLFLKICLAGPKIFFLSCGCITQIPQIPLIPPPHSLPCVCLRSLTWLAVTATTKKSPSGAATVTKNRSSTHTEIKGGVSTSKVFKINRHDLWFCPSPVYPSEAGCGHHPRQTFTQKLSVDLTEPHTPKHTHTAWAAPEKPPLLHYWHNTQRKKSEITRCKP